MLRIFGRGSFRNNSYSVVCDAVGNYYVSDIVGHTISVFDSEGNIRKRFGNLGDKLINFNQPVALAINERKRLFISDSQNHCVKVNLVQEQYLIQLRHMTCKWRARVTLEGGRVNQVSSITTSS